MKKYILFPIFIIVFFSIFNIVVAQDDISWDISLLSWNNDKIILTWEEKIIQTNLQNDNKTSNLENVENLLKDDTTKKIEELEQQINDVNSTLESQKFDKTINTTLLQDKTKTIKNKEVEIEQLQTTLKQIKDINLVNEINDKISIYTKEIEQLTKDKEALEKNITNNDNLEKKYLLAIESLKSFKNTLEEIRNDKINNLENKLLYVLWFLLIFIVWTDILWKRFRKFKQYEYETYRQIVTSVVYLLVFIFLAYLITIIYPNVIVTLLLFISAIIISLKKYIISIWIFFFNIAFKYHIWNIVQEWDKFYKIKQMSLFSVLVKVYNSKLERIGLKSIPNDEFIYSTMSINDMYYKIKFSFIITNIKDFIIKFTKFKKILEKKNWAIINFDFQFKSEDKHKLIIYLSFNKNDINIETNIYYDIYNFLINNEYYIDNNIDDNKIANDTMTIKKVIDDD